MLRPYTPDKADGVNCPDHRPASFGLHVPIRQVVRGLSGDLWRVIISGEIEITVSLIDCFAPPLFDASEEDSPTIKINEQGRRCYDQAWRLLEAGRGQLSVLIPTPAVDRGWLRSLNTDSKLPGWIWLTDRHTLNAALVAKQLASRTPPHPPTTSRTQRRAA